MLYKILLSKFQRWFTPFSPKLLAELSLSHTAAAAANWRRPVLSILPVLSVLPILSVCLIFISGSARAQSSGGDKTASDKADNFTAAFNTLKRNDSLQFELTRSPPPPQTPKWLEAIGAVFEAIFSFIGGIIQLLTPLLYALFWLGIGAFCMAILYLLITTLLAARLSKRGTKPVKASPALYQPESAQARILLAQVDDLAAQGKYAEAVHRLLFRSIQDIDMNRPNVIRRSLTSREIAELKILTPKSAQVFSNIAATVERAFFGGQNIVKPDFDRVRADYVDLTQTSDHSASGTWTAPKPNPKAGPKPMNAPI